MIKVLLGAFGVMGLCLVIHVSGMLMVGEELVRQRHRIENRIGFAYASLVLISAFAVMIVLHVLEAAIWAAVYQWQDLFKDFETSLYFSLKSYSTVGYGDVVLPPNWRLLGTIEGISGVLLCGLSAAFLFAIVSALFRFRVQRFNEEEISRTKG